MNYSEYTMLQIIKHSLKHYVKRPDASEKDIAQEKHVLNKVEERIEILKDKYRIQDKTKCKICGVKMSQEWSSGICCHCDFEEEAK